jgi:hypothetical protein
MAFIRDLMVIIRCTELMERRDPDPMEPLTTYLESGGPVTPLLREWLIKLFKVDKTQRHHLTV